VPLLYSLLQSEEECLQAGALEVLTEIAGKRMDAEAKLRLLQQLGIVATAASWRQGLPGDALGEVPLKAARLLATLCSGDPPPPTHTHTHALMHGEYVYIRKRTQLRRRRLPGDALGKGAGEGASQGCALAGHPRQP